ncbi:MAG: DUF3416 domain-containing protein, partial [Candidatus Latescibacteria bacterium]|nr:DUF3416 domain-containing protein [Candidatus Latescibacterota bacterium]NIO78123.1 DUF3416 domain-containing protein [Candidatus Latescibacterota bacterium]
NDRWRGEFTVTEQGIYCYTLQAWPDPFQSWRQALFKKVEANQDVSVDLLVGSALVEEASQRATGSDAKEMKEWAKA